jgi:hypothetical protein
MALLREARRYVEQDAWMMDDINRFAPLDAESQATHDSTEYPSERLLRRIDAALAAMGGELPEPAPSAEPSVDMVQAACEAHLLEWAARVLDGYVYSADDVNDDARACMRAALRAALGVR